MAAPKLSPEDKDKVLQMLAERETFADIAREVGCTPYNINYYATTYKAEIANRRALHDAQIIDRGLRAASMRITRLEKLAAIVEEDLGIRPPTPPKTLDLAISEAKDGTPREEAPPKPIPGVYGIELKVSASGKAFEQLKFKNEQISALRGLYDDIAKEQGQRKQITEVTGKDGGPIELSDADRAKRIAAILNTARERRDRPADNNS